jgi:NIMA (never in mitosis gene a)-related kinase
MNKRPTINKILKLPIIKNRIKNFLSETTNKIEFSHTILHE